MNTAGWDIRDETISKHSVVYNRHGAGCIVWTLGEGSEHAQDLE